MIGLTRDEAHEFLELDAMEPFEEGGGVAWLFEGNPTSRREARWRDLYEKHARAVAVIVAGQPAETG